MRIRVTRVDAGANYRPLPESGSLEVTGKLEPTFQTLAGNRVYAEIHQGEYSVFIDGLMSELEEVVQHYKRGAKKNA